MDLLDLLLLVAAGLAAAGGYRAGFTARAASWVGMTLGLLLASRALPWVVEHQRGADANRLLLVVMAILLGGAVVGQLLGFVLGLRLRVDDRERRLLV